MKKSIFAIAITALVAGTSITSCDSSTKKVEEAAVKVDEASADLTDAKKEFNEEYIKFQLESEERMIENDRQIAELKANKTQLKKEAKADYDKAIKDIEEKNSALRVKMNEYKEEGNDKWESFKREFNHDMDELGKSLKDLTTNNAK
ncbi:MAG: peptidase M23 [Sphingobacteriaceae bacterium]|nr:peptidase M23 [Sphingobacteriaceae bacterium]